MQLSRSLTPPPGRPPVFWGGSTYPTSHPHFAHVHSSSHRCLSSDRRERVDVLDELLTRGLLVHREDPNPYQFSANPPPKFSANMSGFLCGCIFILPGSEISLQCRIFLHHFHSRIS